MRELGISGLPAARETGRCEVVLAAIAKGMTDTRYHIKDKVRISFLLRLFDPISLCYGVIDCADR